MIGPVVSGQPVLSPVMLIGQAPGAHEGPAGKPFAWTAGKTMFRWFGELGVDEAAFRERVYMAAVCRCFPGKAAKGGDRVPAPDEIERCSRHLAAEVSILRPALVIPVGKLAIAQILPDADQLEDIQLVESWIAQGRGHRVGSTLANAAWPAIAARPRARSVLPGSMRCQVDAPDGWGRGATSRSTPWKRARWIRPTTSAS